MTFLVQLFAAVDGGGSDFWHIVVTGHQKYLKIPQAVGRASQDQLPQCVYTTHHSILQSVNQKINPVFDYDTIISNSGTVTLVSALCLRHLFLISLSTFNLMQKTTRIVDMQISRWHLQLHSACKKWKLQIEHM